MTDPRVVDAALLAPVLRTLAGADWPVPVGQVPALVASLGWTVVPGTGGRSVQADTGWGLRGTAAEFASDKLALATVSFGVTDDVVDDAPWRARFLREAFSAVVGVAAAEFGAATDRVGRPTPHAWWDVAGGGRIEVATVETAVLVGAYSAEYAEEIRRLTDEPAGG